MMAITLQVDDIDYDILEADTAKYNTSKRALNPEWVDLTAGEYLNYLLHNWYGARREEQIETTTQILKERYKSDPEFRSRVDAFLQAP